MTLEALEPTTNQLSGPWLWFPPVEIPIFRSQIFFFIIEVAVTLSLATVLK